MITEAMVKGTKEFLGEDGIEFFKEMVKKHGEISPVFMEGRIPHPVHFREGMQIRNYLRSSGFCNDWNDHILDDQWINVINKVLEGE